MTLKTKECITIPLLIINLVIPVYALFTYPAWLVNVGTPLSYIYFGISIWYLAASSAGTMVTALWFGKEKQKALEEQKTGK